MIAEYLRPESLEEALGLLAGPGMALPLGGGTLLNAPQDASFAVVDLQRLGLDALTPRGKFLDIGAACTLGTLAAWPELFPELRDVIFREATGNLRNQGTVAGTLVAADGRSPFGCALLALDAQLALEPGGETWAYGQALHRRVEATPGLPYLPGRLITRVTLNAGVGFAYEFVARSPADRPVVMAAAALWPSGRLRIAIGGWGRAPRLALDAPEPGGIAAAAESAAAEAGDQWAGAEYRREMAVILAERVVGRVAASS